MVGGTPNVLVVPAVAAGEDAAPSSSRTPRPTRASSRTARRVRARSRISRWSSSRSPTDLDMQHVAYRGIGPAITDILGGQTQALFPGLAAALPHIKAGKMRPLAVTGIKRHPLLPDVPTFEELGYKGFDGVQWYGIVGPANLPPADRHDAQRARSTRCSPIRRCASGCRARRCEPMPMTPDAVRPVHARRHREVDEGRQGTQHRTHGLHAMAHNTKVAADANAPPITRILAEFVAEHPSGEVSRGGRARGASHVPELARLRDRRRAAPDARGRARGGAGARAFAAGDGARTRGARRHRERRAAERHLVAHVRLRRHASRRRSSIPPDRSRRRRSRWPSTSASTRPRARSTRWCSASTSRAASAT